MVLECRKRRASQMECSSEDTDPAASALDCSGVGESSASSSDDEREAKRRRIKSFKKHYLSRAREKTTLAAMRCCCEHIHGTRGGSPRRAS